MSGFGLAQAAAETAAFKSRQHRFGVSFKEGHRVGFRDGVKFAGPSWNTITPADQDDHRQECRWGCIFDSDHRVFGTCTSCQGDTEALGPDELSACCLRPTILTPEETRA